MSKTKKMSFMFMFVISNVGILMAPALSASEINAEDPTIIEQEQIEKFDDYVIQSSVGYSIKNSAYAELSSEEINQLKEQLSITNASFDVSEYEDTGKEYTNTIKDSELGKGYRSAGVTKVRFYWWGYQLYLSKNFVRSAGAVASGAASFIASKLALATRIGAAVAGAISWLGYKLTSVPHGVVLKCTYAGQVTKVWWQ